MIGGPFSYGTESIFTPGKRWRFNIVAVVLNVFLPWVVFSVVYATQSFQVHFLRPHVAFGIVVAGFAIAAGAGCLAYRAKARERDPMWYTFSALCLFLATLLGWTFGDLNYRANMQPFYDMDNLNTYNQLDPAVIPGQGAMDSGKVYFKEGTAIDTRKSIGYKDDSLYCAAPIARGDDQLATYDYWAIGVDCCSATNGDWKCGEWDNPHARGGLRLMRDEQRPMFLLAVQMAETAYNIKSQHPLFFQWLQDPVAKMDTYRDDGYKYFLWGISCHFIFNLMCVASSVAGFSKMGWGYYW